MHQQVILITYGQASIVAQPGEGARDFPAFAVATRRAAVFEEEFGAPAAMQILSHISCSSHCRNRRQQVLAAGYCLGKSRQRGPFLAPTSTARLSAQGRIGSVALTTVTQSASIATH